MPLWRQPPTQPPWQPQPPRKPSPFVAAATTAYRDITARVRVAVGGFKDATVRVRQSVRAYRDTTVRVYASIRGFRDATARVRQAATAFKDATVRLVTPALPALVTSPSDAQTGTTVTTDLSPDGITWAQGHPLVVDQYGKLIIVAQNNTGTKKEWFVYSNDQGATWNDPSDLNQFAITRGSTAYDPVNDILHVLWNATNVSDGIIYRRYTISRDGSHNITGFTKDPNVNLQLDLNGSEYEHPVMLWIPEGGANGSLLACWGTYAGSGHEVRASMRVLSNSSADNTAGNWVAPVSSDTDTIGNAPAVDYSILASGTRTNAPYPSLSRKTAGTHAKDLYLCYARINSGGAYEWRWRRFAWDSGSNNWSGTPGTDALITLITRAGTDSSGYSLKYQLGTEPREDSVNDRMCFGFSSYKDNTDKDTWSYIGIENDDSLTSIVDVYTAGSNSDDSTKFVSGDLVVDQGYVIASYTDLPNKSIYVRAFDSTGTEAQAATLFDDAAPFDIPTLWQSGTTVRYTISGTDYLLFTTRDYNAEATDTPPTYTPPYNGYFGTMAFENAAATTAYRDITARLTVAIRAFKDATARVRIAITAFRDVTARVRVGITNYRDVTFRVRQAITAYKDATFRVRQAATAFRDATARTRTAVRNTRDATVRVYFAIRGFRDATARVRWATTAYKDATLRFASQAQNQGFKDATARIRIFGRAFRDVAVRVYVGIRGFKDSTFRVRASIRAYKDVTARARFAARAFNDATVRARTGIRAIRDSTVRVYAGIRGFTDATLRTHYAATTYRDSRMRIKISLSVERDLTYTIGQPFSRWSSSLAPSNWSAGVAPSHWTAGAAQP